LDFFLHVFKGTRVNEVYTYMLFVAIGNINIMVKHPNSLKNFHVLIWSLLYGVWGSAEESHLTSDHLFWPLKQYFGGCLFHRSKV